MELNGRTYNMESQISEILGLTTTYFGQDFSTVRSNKFKISGNKVCAHLLYMFTSLSLREISEILNYKSASSAYFSIWAIRQQCIDSKEAQKEVISLETLVELSLEQHRTNKQSEDDFSYCTHFGCTNVLTPQQQLFSNKCSEHINHPNVYSLIDKYISI